MLFLQNIVKKKKKKDKQTPKKNHFSLYDIIMDKELLIQQLRNQKMGLLSLADVQKDKRMTEISNHFKIVKQQIELAMDKEIQFVQDHFKNDWSDCMSDSPIGCLDPKYMVNKSIFDDSSDSSDDNSIEGMKLRSGMKLISCISTNNNNCNKINGDKINGNKINGDKKNSNKRNGDKINGNKKNSNKRNSNKINSNKINGNEINGNKRNGNKINSNKRNGNGNTSSKSYQNVLDYIHSFAISTNNNGWKCGYKSCKWRPFDTKNGVINHIATQHCTSSKYHTLHCAKCKSSFVLQYKLTKHMVDVHKQSKYKCSKCKKGYNCKTRFNSHRQQCD